MLDLNVDIDSVDSTCGESNTKITNDKLLRDVEAQMDDSGTSNSSVINVDEALKIAGDEDSSPTTHSKPSNTVSAFNFDILNKGKDSTVNIMQIEDKCDENSALALVTMQLFSVAGDGGVGDSKGSVSGSSSAKSAMSLLWPRKEPTLL